MSKNPLVDCFPSTDPMEERAGSSRKRPRSCFADDDDVDYDVREPSSKKKPITWVIVDFQMSIEPDSGFCCVGSEDDGDWVDDEYYYDHWFEPRYEQEGFGPFLPLGDARATRKVPRRFVDGDVYYDEYCYEHGFGSCNCDSRDEPEWFGPLLPLGGPRNTRKVPRRFVDDDHVYYDVHARCSKKPITWVAVEVESDSGFNPVWFEDEEEGSEHWLDDDYYSDHGFDSSDCDSNSEQEAFESDTVGCGTSQELGMCGQDNNRPHDCYHDNGIKSECDSNDGDKEIKEEKSAEREVQEKYRRMPGRVSAVRDWPPGCGPSSAELVAKSDEDDEEFEEEYEEEEEGFADAGLIQESTSSDCEGKSEKLSGKEVDVNKSSEEEYEEAYRKWMNTWTDLDLLELDHDRWEFDDADDRDEIKGDKIKGDEKKAPNWKRGRVSAVRDWPPGCGPSDVRTVDIDDEDIEEFEEEEEEEEDITDAGLKQ